MNVAIAGYGVEGKANYEYWLALGHDVTVVDEGDLAEADIPVGTPSILGAGAFSQLTDFDMVVRTAGLSPKKIRTNGKIWSATNEFFDKCPAPIIGVTGTKGKGTTSSLITEMLRADGRTVHLVGNIGVPALAELENINSDDLVVFELSSFQLWDLEKSPHVAVVLMLEPDHLDVHDDMDDYVAAKSNISRHQTTDDICIYHPTNQLSHQVATAGQGKTVRYGIPDDGQVYAMAGTFFVQQDAIGSVDTLQVVGEHNVENACAAISAARVYTTNENAILTGLSAFTGLPHRLKHVRDVRGVGYYDDSIATTPGSAIAAIQSFEQPKILILGGKDKGGDYAQLVELCRTTNTRVIAIGENGPIIATMCREAGVDVVELAAKSMDEIVEYADEIAMEGDVVILSPAAASFDMFASYGDRGDKFIAAVRAL